MRQTLTIKLLTRDNLTLMTIFLVTMKRRKNKIRGKIAEKTIRRRKIKRRTRLKKIKRLMINRRKQSS